MRPEHAALKSSAGRWTFFLLCALVLWAPLPLASNRVWASVLLAVALAALVLGVAIADHWRDKAPERKLGKAALPIGFLGGFAVLILIQTLDWGSGTISVDAYHSLLYALLTVGYLSAFLVVLLRVNSGDRMRTLAMVIVVSGVLQALLAILLYSAKAKYSLFYFELNHNRALGTFSYRNSLANYLTLCLCIGIGLIVAQMRESRSTENFWRALAHDTVGFMLSPAMRLRLMLVVMVIALVLTHSRGGNASFLLALLLVGVPVLALMGRLSRKTLWLVASVLVIDLAVVGNLVGADRVIERLNQTPVQTLDRSSGEPDPIVFSEQSLEHRGAPGAQALMGMVSQRPLLGFGAGTFYTAYPRFASADYRGYYDHAHQDYFQIAAETGPLGLGLLGGLVIMTLWRVVRVLQKPYSPTDSGLAFGILLAIAAMLVHGLFDFNFQIPANALTFVVILALAWVLRRRTEDRPQRSELSCQLT
jgi:O-antigen ligase